MSSGFLRDILEKIESRDKDFRYMATSDLATELTKPLFAFTCQQTEHQIVNAVIKQLEDQSGDISSLANRCAGLLINKVRIDHVTQITSTLCDKHANAKKEQTRDVAALALKTVLTADITADATATALVTTATPLIIQGLASPHPDVVSNSLDMLSELAVRYGSLIPNPDAVQQALLPELDQGRAGTRKKAIQCLAALATSLSLTSLHQLMEIAVTKLEQQGGGGGGEALKADGIRTYIQLLGALCRSVGSKFSIALPRAVPVVLQQLERAAESDDEMREYCLQSLESFVVRCSEDVRPMLDGVIPLCLKYIKYDPNYQDDDDDGGDDAMYEDDNDNNDGGMEDDADEDEDDEEYSEEEYSDDEDTSWKVRRASARLLTAIIGHYPDLFLTIYSQVASPVIARIKDREETVKIEVMGTLEEVARQVTMANRRGDTKPSDALLKDMPKVIKLLAKQLKEKQPKTRAAVFKLLLELSTAAPDAVAGRLALLVPGIGAALADKLATSSTLKIPALQFLSTIITTSTSSSTNNKSSTIPPQIINSVPSLAPPIFAATKERYYKVAAEAVRVCQKLVLVIRPDPLLPLLLVSNEATTSVPPPPSSPVAAMVQPLFECILERLKTADQDQEVKEATIACMADIVAYLGDVLGDDTQQVTALTEDFAAMPKSKGRKRAKIGGGGSGGGGSTSTSPRPQAVVQHNKQFPEVFKLLMERVRNEMTRVSAVKAFTTIAKSPLISITDMSSFLPELLPELTSYLRKINRALRQSSLHCLTALVTKHGASLLLAAVPDGRAVLQSTVTEAAILINDTDLAVAALALDFMKTILTDEKNKEMDDIADVVTASALPAATALIRSPLLQGAALEGVQVFLNCVVEQDRPAGSGASFEEVLNTLLVIGREEAATGAAAGDGSTKTAQHATAQCMAGLCVAAGQARVDSTVQDILLPDLVSSSGGAAAVPKGKDKKATTTTSNSSRGTSAKGAQQFALLCLGELGRMGANLTSFPQITDILPQALSHGENTIAEAASFALGGVASGNMPSYLPLLLSHVKSAQSEPKKLYQLLKALNQVITTAAVGTTGGGVSMPGAQQQEVLQLLLECKSGGEDECTGVIADCLGHLALLNAGAVIPALKEQLTAEDEASRTVAVAALRHALVAHHQQQQQVAAITTTTTDGTTTMVDAVGGIDAELPQHIGDFLATMGDEDRHVRKAAVGVLSTAVLMQPQLVAQHLPSTLPLLFAQTVKNPDLVRIINLGPFKHEIDDGLELRKASFECLAILLENCYDQVDAAKVIDHVLGGLGDHYDVKLPSHSLVIKMTHIAPGHMTAALDQLVEPLTATLQSKTKADAVKQEKDRHDDLLRSCLRAVDALANLPNAMSVPAFKGFMEGVVGSGDMREKYASVKEERKEAEKAGF